jgi:predicted nucleic acid-binding protein
VIVDTSALLALFDRSDPHHRRTAAAIEGSSAPMVVSPYVLAELDYLILDRHGPRAEKEVIGEFASGSWELATMPPPRLTAALEVMRRFRDQRIGLTDASLIVLGEAYRTRDVLTLDRRHFSILRFSDDSSPNILPAP